jgi:peptidoglycan/xylan/chitin deacetylase (PgdA/CDA1 family)
MQALFFINSGLINLYGSATEQKEYVRTNLLLTERETLSWDGVRALRDSGHTIGGHSVHHARLGNLSDEEAGREIMEDKARLEAELGERVSMFAYPFGNESDYTKVTKAKVKEAGYDYAFTTKASFAGMDDRYSIPRICIENGQSVSSIGRWIQGGYDVYRMMKRICVR